MDSIIDIDLRALHGVAARIEAAAASLRAGELTGGLTAAAVLVGTELAGTELMGTAVHWQDHLTRLAQAVAGTGTVLHAVADTYTQAHAAATRGWVR